MRVLQVTAIIFSLLALSIAPLSAGAANEDSPYYSLPAGSKFVLKRQLTVPAGQASIFIQGGQVRTFSEVYQYEPHCKVEMQRLTNNPQTIQPGEFVVDKMRRERSQHGALPGFVYVLDSFDRSYERYSTHFYLSSGQQPEVFRVTCQQWQDPAWPKHVTLRQINQTLGDLLSLQAP